MKTEIERYIAGKMTIEEAKKLENLMISDKELTKEYKATLAANQLIKEVGRLELKETLESFDKEMNNSKSTKVMRLWIKRVLPLAAMLVIFFGVYQLMMLNTPISGNEIYDTYFEVYSNPSVVRSSENFNLNNWDIAANYYREKEYEKAITYFEKPNTEVPNYLLTFYIGISSLALESPNYTKALENFEVVLNTGNDYQQQAMWYKGLTLLEIDKKEDALEVFGLIVTNKSYNYLKAEEILNLKIKN
ncbi:MAG: hypothetical protein COB12_09785 [Flavobacterium sp.]|nr:MAG: hypothetical protein COB12_09785 [Flavobacterium sp.]